MSQSKPKTLNIEFFDSNAFIGQPLLGVRYAASSSRELLREMDDNGISKALVWHIVQHDYSPKIGNEITSNEISESSRLYGVWTLLPPNIDDVICDDFISKMKKNRIAALRIFPEHHGFEFDEIVFGKFIHEIVERKVPLILSLPNKFIDGVSWQFINELMKAFPELTCIICNINRFYDRYTYPLLENYPNIYLETSLASIRARALENLVNRFGSGRLVFGSGYPLGYPQAPMLQLIHAEISDEDKKQIASSNLEKIISEIVYE